MEIGAGVDTFLDGDIGNETVTACRYGFDVAGHFGVITQRLAQLGDGATEDVLGNEGFLFYTWVAVGVAVIVFAGFAQTYYLKAFFGTPALTLLFHIHGLLMTTWFVLFFVQGRLVASHRTEVHRRLGVAGAALAGLIVVIAIDVALTSARRHLAADPNSDALVFLPLPLIGVAVFAIIVAAAILLRRRPEYHKRLMVLACVSILAAGIDRVPLHFIENAGRVTLFGLNDLCLVAPMAYDTLRNRKLHLAWVSGSLLFVGSQGLILAVRNMPAWLRFAAWLVK